ncbi:hypothetical protein SAMN05444285_11656 [Draconibacterium orientale]|uniref:Uncharacterized protein n=1 Tax=Draconibacterium orientale TaxID=1168034 RepID=A0A1I0FEE4_9BACT|nr:hypothetical protein SAMN05444285_11656 [Draconibacterium orientale]
MVILFAGTEKGFTAIDEYICKQKIANQNPAIAASFCI